MEQGHVTKIELSTVIREKMKEMVPLFQDLSKKDWIIADARVCEHHGTMILILVDEEKAKEFDGIIDPVCLHGALLHMAKCLVEAMVDNVEEDEIDKIIRENSK